MNDGKYFDINNAHCAKRENKTENKTQKLEFRLGDKLHVTFVIRYGPDAVMEKHVPEEYGWGVDTGKGPDDDENDDKVAKGAILTVAECVRDGKVPVQRHGYQVQYRGARGEVVQ